MANREIKFRAWIAEIQKFRLIDNAYDLQYYSWSSSEWGPTRISDMKDAWEQFTGLQDSKGVDIYEGDIIQAPHDFGPGGMIERVAAVRFDSVVGYQWASWDLNGIVVIGNIHEHPELLT